MTDDEKPQRTIDEQLEGLGTHLDLLHNMHRDLMQKMDSLVGKIDGFAAQLTNGQKQLEESMIVVTYWMEHTVETLEDTVDWVNRHTAAINDLRRTQSKSGEQIERLTTNVNKLTDALLGDDPNGEG